MSRRPPAPNVPVRAWQRMLSGRRLDLLDPSPLDIEIEDIAHGLARVARWNGQTHGAYGFSVAQHSLLVDTLLLELHPSADAAAQLRALLHDAAEFVIGDLISPFKSAVGGDYRRVEAGLERAIARRFGLAYPAPPLELALIKRADGMAAHLEATQLAGFSAKEADALFTPPTCRPATLEPWAAERAKAAFLARFEALTARRPLQT